MKVKLLKNILVLSLVLKKSGIQEVVKVEYGNCLDGVGCSVFVLVNQKAADSYALTFLGAVNKQIHLCVMFWIGKSKQKHDLVYFKDVTG